MKLKKLSAALFLALMLALAVAPAASANSAEPPQLTIVVTAPPKDLSLFLTFDNAGMTESVGLTEIKTAWEAMYRITGFRISAYGDISQVRLIAAYGGKTLEFPLTEEVLTRYNNVYTLNLKNGTLTDGYTLGRSVSLVSMRVIFTLILEGLVFYAFGYRKKASWITFLAVNLITQGALNIALNGTRAGSYMLIGLLFYEALVLISELIAFSALLREHNDHRFECICLMNLLSLILGGLLITRLPV